MVTKVLYINRTRTKYKNPNTQYTIHYWKLKRINVFLTSSEMTKLISKSTSCHVKQKILLNFILYICLLLFTHYLLWFWVHILCALVEVPFPEIQHKKHSWHEHWRLRVSFNNVTQDYLRSHQRTLKPRENNHITLQPKTGGSLKLSRAGTWMGVVLAHPAVCVRSNAPV